jgi:hypothetical protein
VSKAKSFLNMLDEKKDEIQWEHNTIGGIKGIYLSRSGVEFRIDVNPSKSGFSWMVGRASSDRFMGQGEADTQENAKKQAIKFLKGMEARGIA